LDSGVGCRWVAVVVGNGRAVGVARKVLAAPQGSGAKDEVGAAFIGNSVAICVNDS